MDNFDTDRVRRLQASHILPPTGASQEGSGNGGSGWERELIAQTEASLQNVILCWERETFHSIIPQFYLDSSF